MSMASQYPLGTLTHVLGLDSQGRVRRQAVAELAAGQGGGAAGIVTTPATLTVGSGAAPGTVIATLAAPSLVGPSVFAIVTPSGKYAIEGTNLVVGAVEIDIADGTADTIALRATGADGVSQVQEVKPITITTTGGFVTVDLNFVTGYQFGDTFASALAITQAVARNEIDSVGASIPFAANTLRRTNLGWWVNGESHAYIGRQSKTPNSWPAGGYLAPAGKTVLAVTPDGFTPIRVAFLDPQGDALAPVATRAFVLNEELVVKLKVAPVAGHSTVGGRIVINSVSLGTGLSIESGDLTVPNPSVGFFDGANFLRAGSLSSRKLADGSVEIIFGLTARAVDMTFAVSPASSAPSGGGNLDVWGWQVETGTAETGWVATTTTTVTLAADDSAVVGGSALGQVLAAATGSLLIETQGLAHSSLGTLGYPNSIAGVLLKIGASDLLKPRGPTGFIANAQAEIGLGISGFRGIVRTVITWDPTGWAAWSNGSKKASGSGAFTHAGAIKLAAGISGRVRRIAAAPVKLSDANGQAWSRIWNRNFTRYGAVPGCGAALVLGAAYETYYDDFDGVLNDSLLRQTTRNYPYEPRTLMPVSYNLGGPNAKWIPRFHFYGDKPEGMNVAINNQPQFHVDPQQTGAWTGSHAVAASCLELQIKLTSQLTAGEQAQVPTNPVTGVKHRYVAGLATTAGKFSQKYGVFSARSKIDAFLGSWINWWTFGAAELGGTENEQDIEEYHGRNPNKTTSAIHLFSVTPNINVDSSNGGNDLGYNLSLDFHDRTGIWVQGELRKYFDGELITTQPINWPAFNDGPQHLVLEAGLENIEGTVASPHPDRNTMETALGTGKKMYTDRVRVLQFGV